MKAMILKIYEDERERGEKSQDVGLDKQGTMNVSYEF